MPKTMLAVAKDKAGACGIIETAVPQPKRDEVLIRVHAASVNHGDWAIGKPLHAGTPGKQRSIMCADAAGVVIACGSAVVTFKPGDEVCAATTGLKGALAEYAVAKQSWCARKPQSMSWEAAATIPSAGVTALAAVEKVHAGDKVLVVGASGGVGQFALVLAAQKGCEADAVCGRKSAKGAVRLGARHTYDYTQGLGSVRGPYDCVLAINGTYPAREYARILRPGGSLVLVGFDSLRPSILLAAAKGARLRMALFFARIGSGGLQKACDALSACEETPTLEVVQGLDAAVNRLTTLTADHPHGKLVIAVG